MSTVVTRDNFLRLLCYRLIESAAKGYNISLSEAGYVFSYLSINNPSFDNKLWHYIRDHWTDIVKRFSALN